VANFKPLLSLHLASVRKRLTKGICCIKSA
jgi:hypothetical protein